MNKRDETKTYVGENGRECTLCLEFKEWHLFPVSNQNKTGRGTRCNECLREIRKEKYVPRARNSSYDRGAYFCDKYSLTGARHSF